MSPQRFEHLSGDARPALHPLADHGQNRLAGFVLEAHQLVLKLEPEFLSDAVNRAVGVGAEHRKTDGVLGGRLRDEDDVHTPGSQSAEQTLGDARHPHHSRSTQRQQREIPNRRDALRQPLPVGAPLGGNERARRRRFEGVLDQNGDALGDCRSDGGRMEHLRAEVGQLHRLFVADLRQHECRGDCPGIRAQDAVHIGPDFDDGRTDGCADDRRAVVRSVAADGRRLAILGRGDETGHDRNHAGAASKQPREVRAGRAVRFAENDVRVGELIVGDEELPGIGELRRVRLVEIRGDDQSRQTLAEARRHVQSARGAVAEQMNPL